MSGQHSYALDNALLILEILRRIPRRNFTTSTHLREQVAAAGYEVSLRTVQRHLDAICARFAIECDTRGKPFGYRWIEGAEGLMSTGDGFNVSLGILVAHGWFYVVYLFACFRMWSLMRWRFPRFIMLALGGVIPFLSFFMEARVARDGKAYLAAREASAASAPAPEGVR